MEIWKDIEDYEGFYQVSNLGKIKSLDKRDAIGRFIKGKIMSPIIRKDGYLQITLHKNKKGRKFLIHRLVAETFIENKNKCKEINHKDEDKTNNKVYNLEWCDRKYNVNYGSANENRRKALLNKKGKRIIQINENDEVIKIFPSLMQVVRELKLNKSHLSQCCNGKRKTTGGFCWKYVEN